ncbi:MAG: Xaa-Pro peptidase family protein [Actinomycetota bacterium]|nr:Xaa-Pro peptidase family protein [Actinomycetota bacterium]
MENETQRLAGALHRASAFVALLSSAEDVCYATGFEVPPPIDAGAAFAWGPAVALVSAEGETKLLVPNAYAARAEEMSRADETVLVATFGHFAEVDGRAEFLASIRAALLDLGVDRSTALAVDAATLPAAVAEFLDSELGSPLIDLAPIIRAARLIKTPREIELLRAAVAAADAGQAALLDLARPGSNELEVLGQVLTLVDRRAGQPVPWTGELVSGPRTAILRYPGGPIDREMKAGDTLIFDLSVRFKGYWADCCNTLAVDGTASEEQLRYFRAARNAFEAAVEQLRPGRRASEVHAAAQRELDRHGLQPAHYTGHQLGTTVNEDPRLVPYEQMTLAPGMVFAVEPGAYAGPDGSTGARTEKVVLVTEDDPEILSTFPWGMEG